MFSVIVAIITYQLGIRDGQAITADKWKWRLAAAIIIIIDAITLFIMLYRRPFGAA